MTRALAYVQHCPFLATHSLTFVAKLLAIVCSECRAVRSLITNARCLTEGVDVPNIDCVLFADAKRSTIDIVRAVGRALRPAKGKRCGYTGAGYCGR